MATRTVAIFESATPTSAHLEAEWGANWKGLKANYNDGPWLFVRVKMASYSAAVKIYVRSALGDELNSGAAIWGLHPDGAATVTTPDPSDGWATLRYYIGEDVAGVVVASATAGTAQLSMSEA